MMNRGCFAGRDILFLYGLTNGRLKKMAGDAQEAEASKQGESRKAEFQLSSRTFGSSWE
jgi:hypothetical protein